MSTFTALEPQHLWDIFYTITQTPRPSKKEEQIIQYIKNFLQAKNITYFQDEIGNILAKIPATAGLSKAPTVLLQSHVDMVCEKESYVNLNFDTDPLPVYVEGDLIKSKGTTLGADNGIGVAMALAIITDKNVKHGPLEMLFTIDEETGLTGANKLDASNIESTMLLNIDTEDEGEFCIGCAGGTQCDVIFPVTRVENASLKCFSLSVDGLFGGHSGVEIHKNRANAIKILASCLNEINTKYNISIFNLLGGTKHNAIPRSANVVFGVYDASVSKETLQNYLSKKIAGLKQQFATIDAKLNIIVASENTPQILPITPASTSQLINFLLALPHGVLGMSIDLPGVVETSSNLAIANLQNNELNICISVRSSVTESKFTLATQIQSICSLAGGTCIISGGYPAWQPNAQSVLLKTACSTWESLFKTNAKVTAIHAGLECGIILEKCKNMVAAISFGPDIKNAHTPQEQVSIGSTARMYDFLKELLINLAKN